MRYVSFELSHRNVHFNYHISSNTLSAFNTLRPRQSGRHFADDIFKCIFLNENVWSAIEISVKFVPKGPINNIPALVQIMAWRRSDDKPLSEPMMVSSLTSFGLNELMPLLKHNLSMQGLIECYPNKCTPEQCAVSLILALIISRDRMLLYMKYILNNRTVSWQSETWYPYPFHPKRLGLQSVLTARILFGFGGN